MIRSRPPKKTFWICLGTLKSIIYNIKNLAPTNDISFIITSCNCSYQHVSLFNEFDGNFDKLNNDCWTCTSNPKFFVRQSIFITPKMSFYD